MTGNDQYQDALIARALEIERLKGTVTERIMEILNRTEDELILSIDRGLGSIRTPQQGLKALGSNRFQRLLEEIQEIRGSVWVEANALLEKELFSLSEEEAALVLTMLPGAVGVELSMVLPAAALLQAIVTSDPFRGRILSEWANGLEVNDLQRIRDVIQIGMVQGETLSSIIQRIQGTRAAGFTDGVLQIGRREAEAVVLTAISHVSNAAREVTWLANSDIIKGIRWTAVLDGRTTPICQARDGKVVSFGKLSDLPRGTQLLVPPGARPPAHFRCRSIMVAIVSAAGVVGDRPFVISTLTGKKRQVNFRNMAKASAGDRWKTMGRTARNTQVANVRKQWALDRVGTVPAETTYQQFLSRQSASFQDDVLGPARGSLFRDGVTVDQLVTSTGRNITLGELRTRLPSFF